MADTKKKTKKKTTPISRAIEPDPKPVLPKVTSSDIVNELKDVNNAIDNLAIIMNNVLEEIRTSNQLNADILRKINTPTVPSNVVKPSSPMLPPPPIMPEVPNTGTPFPSPGTRTGDPLPQQPIISSAPTIPTSTPGPVSLEQAGAILKQKLAERQQSQPSPQQVPTGKSAGGTTARPAKPMDGIAQVGDIRDAVKIDWLGEGS